MKKYLVEFIGTFFLMLTIVTCVNGTAGQLAPVAIGAVLIGVIYAGGHISRAHYNPAITVAIWIRGHCETKDIPGYIIAQLLAAILAAYAGQVLVGDISGAVGVSSGSPIPILSGLLAEFLGTFILAFVILNVGFAKGTEGNSFYGTAIGLTVVGCAYGLGGVTGGAFNPAVALGVSFVEMTPWSNFWIFLLAEFSGATLAALAFLYSNGND